MKFLWMLIVVLALVAADDSGSETQADNNNDNTDAPSGNEDTGVDDVEGRTRNAQRKKGSKRFFGGGGIGGRPVGHGVGPVGGFGGNPSFGGGFGGINPGFGGGFGGVNQGFGGGFGGVNPGFGGGFGGVNPGFGGGFGGVNPGFGGGIGGVNPGFGGGIGGVNPGFGSGFGGVNPGFGGGFGGVNPGFGGGFGGVNPGLGGGFGSVAPPSACRYWCRTPQGQAYCCENVNQPQSFAGVIKPGQCPPVRPVCPPIRNFAPPASCSNDGACGGIDKCCFDTCLQQHTCKAPLGIGR